MNLHQLLCLCVLNISCLMAGDVQRPNIILMLTDDQVTSVHFDLT